MLQDLTRDLVLKLLDYIPFRDSFVFTRCCRWTHSFTEELLRRVAIRRLLFFRSLFKNWPDFIHPLLAKSTSISGPGLVHIILYGKVNVHLPFIVSVQSIRLGECKTFVLNVHKTILWETSVIPADKMDPVEVSFPSDDVKINLEKLTPLFSREFDFRHTLRRSWYEAMGFKTFTDREALS